jgi:hypothetical protein
VNQNKNPDPGPTETSVEDQFTIVLGGVEREITLRNGQREKVTIRQLPIRLLIEWSRLIGDEAALVELYCAKRNSQAMEQLRKLQAEEFGLIQLLAKPENAEQVQKVSGELAMVRNKMDKLKEETSWDDQLTPESHDEIIRIGDKINRPRFDRWIADRHKSLGHLKDMYREFLPDHPLLQAERQATPPARSESTSSPESTSSQPIAVSS